MEMDGCLASSVEVFLVSIPLFFGGVFLYLCLVLHCLILITFVVCYMYSVSRTIPKKNYKTCFIYLSA